NTRRVILETMLEKGNEKSNTGLENQPRRNTESIVQEYQK
ncbi:unnamed protein product, partial [Onchocerca ochengi]|uniref:ENTH domain-containing protein n=1 Tax=Onchocerca ochengi TaxID=42157 RepID=A0A182EJA5_ONCOC